VLLIMTDQERYPPPYEAEALARFRREQLPARDPEERTNLAGAEPAASSQLRSILEQQRVEKRLLPRHRNPAT
jgi:hypothetical protein